MLKKANPNSPTETKATDNNYLTLELKNFGPISEGLIRLRPLTILMGTNGCGKSHIATLVHTIINTRLPKPAHWAAEDENLPKSMTTEAERLHRRYKPGQTIDSNVYQTFINHDLKSFKRALLENFAKDEKNLIRIGKRKFKINIISKTVDVIYTSGADPVISSPETTKIKCIKGRFTPEHCLQIRDNVAYMDMPRGTDDADLLFMLEAELGLKYNGISREIKRSVYFPAERAGMMLTLKPLMLDYIDRLGRGLGASFAVPSLADTMVGFLAWMIKPDERKSVFADNVSILEKQMLGGSIVLDSKHAQLQDVYFRHKEKNLPLHTVASSIKSMAAFLLYVKHAASPDEIIILEEPETNLHPDNQLLLARFIAQLVNGGLHIFVTTHSPYFLEQLSHCVLSGMINNKKSAEVLSVGESLKPDDVATYTFRSHDGGYQVVPISISSEAGIPQDEFTSTDDDLYDEIMKLRQASE